MSWPSVARSPILVRGCLLGLRVLAVVFADGGLGGGQVLIGAAGGDQPISIWICWAMPGDVCGGDGEALRARAGRDPGVCR